VSPGGAVPSVRGIHWFRNDLRLQDNTALAALSERVEEWLPIFVLDPRIFSRMNSGQPRVRFLLDCLDRLGEELANRDPPRSDRVVYRSREIRSLGGGHPTVGDGNGRLPREPTPSLIFESSTRRPRDSAGTPVDAMFGAGPRNCAMCPIDPYTPPTRESPRQAIRNPRLIMPSAEKLHWNASDRLEASEPGNECENKAPVDPSSFGDLVVSFGEQGAF
jgi:hypothetical protein